ncbi:MAG TPA: hypothetical protein VM488_11850 [Pseudobacter sp.]|nr:hypothetical protein [Pseudobacter sp.]
MKDEQEYIQDITEMRSMMERSSRFMSLSGLAGVMAGIYALAGAFVAWYILGFQPGAPVTTDSNLQLLVLVGFIVLVLAIGTAFLLSWKKAGRRQEKFGNPVGKRLLINMGVPLVAGGLLVLIMIAKGMTGFIAPFTLLFYGLAQYSAGKYTYDEMKSLGLINLGLGLVGAYFTEYGLLLWALGFGVVHIVYGIYMHYRYER